MNTYPIFFYSSQAHNTDFLVIYFEVNDNIWFQETWKWTLNKITNNNNVHCMYVQYSYALFSNFKCIYYEMETKTENAQITSRSTYIVEAPLHNACIW